MLPAADDDVAEVKYTRFVPVNSTHRVVVVVDGYPELQCLSNAYEIDGQYSLDDGNTTRVDVENVQTRKPQLVAVLEHRAGLRNEVAAHDVADVEVADVVRVPDKQKLMELVDCCRGHCFAISCSGITSKGCVLKTLRHLLYNK